MDTAMYDPTDRVALGTFKVCADEYGCRGGAATLATRRPNLGRFVFGWFVGHRNPMKRHCQFTVKRSAVPPKCAVSDGELLTLLLDERVFGSTSPMSIPMVCTFSSTKSDAVRGAIEPLE